MSCAVVPGDGGYAEVAHVTGDQVFRAQRRYDVATRLLRCGFCR
ncbi:MAG TPA: hypothetical protein VH307_03660 [Streptosporangiaceae bacterium]|nr:hypothetical protein [Streptosporangiaceae bacterium]